MHIRFTQEYSDYPIGHEMDVDPMRAVILLRMEVAEILPPRSFNTEVELEPVPAEIELEPVSIEPAREAPTKCALHPRFKGKSRPKSDCSICWEMWNVTQLDRTA